MWSNCSLKNWIKTNYLEYKVNNTYQKQLYNLVNHYLCLLALSWQQKNWIWMSFYGNCSNRIYKYISICTYLLYTYVLIVFALNIQFYCIFKPHYNGSKLNRIKIPRKSFFELFILNKTKLKLINIVDRLSFVFKSDLNRIANTQIFFV